MKKFTRLASIALCLTLAVLALAACGKKDDDTDAEYEPKTYTVAMSKVGAIQNNADGTNSAIAAAAITEANGVITIKAEKGADAVAVDLIKYFTGSNAIAEGFSFTRDDVKDTTDNTKLAKHLAYKHVGYEEVEGVSTGVNVYVQYGKADNATNRIVDKTANTTNPITKWSLYGETPAMIGAATEAVDASCVYIYSDAEGDFDQTVKFVFTMKNGDTHNLTVKVENAA